MSVTSSLECYDALKMAGDACFCDVTILSVANCLLEKTTVSLPVLITAYAVGYIWSARKQMKDVMKQCDVLEKDMSIIKKENYYLVEEIRRLKCASDTMIFRSRSSRCQDKPKSFRCLQDKFDKPRAFKCSPNRFDLSFKTPLCEFENQCPDRSISKKMKLRKSCPDRVNYGETLTHSLPELSDSFDVPCSSLNKLDTYRMEWSPNAESTRLFDNIDSDVDKCKSNRILKKVDYLSTGSSNRSIKCKRIRKNPKCVRLEERVEAPKNRPHTSQLKETRFKNLRYCLSSENSSRNSLPVERFEPKKCLSTDKAKSMRICNTNNYPKLLESTKRIKEKIEKCKMEITEDLNAIPDSFKYNFTVCRNASGVKICDPDKEDCLKSKCKRPKTRRK